MIESLKSFLKLESAGGILLIMATFLARAFANTDLTATYKAFLRIPVEIRFAESKSLNLCCYGSTMA